MVDKRTYELLKNEFGQYSSWAIWAVETPGCPASNTGDISMFGSSLIHKELHTDYIFFGLNSAAHEKLNNEPWGAFHSNDTKRQRDYKIRYALQNTQYWGSYITDVIKGYPETDSLKIVRQFRNNKDLKNKALKDLKKELKIIGGEPIAIAFGNYAFELLSEFRVSLPSLKDIIKVPHYSTWCSKENYKASLNEILLSKGLPALES